MDSPLSPVQTPRRLVSVVITKLRQAIKDGAFPTEHELPTEPELAKQLGVSRGTLRQAMGILEEEGLLSRRQGSGTFIVPHTASLRNVLNNNFGITELIRDTGGKPGTANMNVAREAANGTVGEKLGIEEGEPLLVIERVRTDDDVPVALTVDYLPIHILENHKLAVDDLEKFLQERESLYTYLREAGMNPVGAVADVHAVAADDRIASALKIKKGASVLELVQTDYGDNGMVILYSEEYLPPHLSVQVWRKGPS